MIVAHIIHEEEGFLSRIPIGGCPRVGDELRLNDGNFYTVTRVIWCLDEDTEYGDSRVNIGVLGA